MYILGQSTVIWTHQILEISCAWLLTCVGRVSWAAAVLLRQLISRFNQQQWAYDTLYFVHMTDFGKLCLWFGVFEYRGAQRCGDPIARTNWILGQSSLILAQVSYFIKNWKCSNVAKWLICHGRVLPARDGAGNQPSLRSSVHSGYCGKNTIFFMIDLTFQIAKCFSHCFNRATVSSAVVQMLCGVMSSQQQLTNDMLDNSALADALRLLLFQVSCRFLVFMNF